MHKPKLDLDELIVSSFATSPAPAASSATVDSIIVNPNDPTAATWCYICPMRTEDCY